MASSEFLSAPPRPTPPRPVQELGDLVFSGETQMHRRVPGPEDSQLQSVLASASCS